MLVDGDKPNSTSTTPVQRSQHPAASAPHPTFRSRHTNHRLSYAAQYRQTLNQCLPKLPTNVHPNIHQTTIIPHERRDSPASRVVRRLSRVFVMRVKALGVGSEGVRQLERLPRRVANLERSQFSGVRLVHPQGRGGGYGYPPRKCRAWWYPHHPLSSVSVW